MERINILELIIEKYPHLPINLALLKCYFDFTFKYKMNMSFLEFKTYDHFFKIKRTDNLLRFIKKNIQNTHPEIIFNDFYKRHEYIH